jgi:hypothetical protein
VSYSWATNSRLRKHARSFAEVESARCSHRLKPMTFTCEEPTAFKSLVQKIAHFLSQCVVGVNGLAMKYVPCVKDAVLHNFVVGVA